MIAINDIDRLRLSEERLWNEKIAFNATFI